MTQNEANKLRDGSMVRNGTAIKGAVSGAAAGSKYVRIDWTDRHGGDVLRRTSPLLRFLEVDQ